MERFSSSDLRTGLYPQHLLHYRVSLVIEYRAMIRIENVSDFNISEMENQGKTGGTILTERNMPNNNALPVQVLQINSLAIYFEGKKKVHIIIRLSLSCTLSIV